MAAATEVAEAAEAEAKAAATAASEARLEQEAADLLLQQIRDQERVSVSAPSQPVQQQRGGRDCTACWMPDSVQGQKTIKCSTPGCNAYFCNVECSRRSPCPHNVDVGDAEDHDADERDLKIGEAAAGLGCQCMLHLPCELVCMHI